MKLTEEALKAIRASGPCKRELIHKLETSNTSLYRWLDENEENGKLTTVLAVNIISEHCSMTQDQILEQITV